MYNIFVILIIYYEHTKSKLVFPSGCVRKWCVRQNDNSNLFHVELDVLEAYTTFIFHGTDFLLQRFKMRFSICVLSWATNWTVVQISGRQFTPKYCVNARWLFYVSAVVGDHSFIIFFCSVIFIRLILMKDSSAPLKVVSSSPRCFTGFDKNTVLTSSSVRKNRSFPTITLLWICTITIPDSKLSFRLNERHGSTCDCAMFIILVWFSRYVGYRRRLDSGIPKSGLITFNTMLDGQFMSTGGQMYTSRSTCEDDWR